MPVYIESGQDPIQNRLRSDYTDCEQQLGLLGQGLWARIKRARLEKKKRKIFEEYLDRAEELAIENRYRGGHG